MQGRMVGKYSSRTATPRLKSGEYAKIGEFWFARTPNGMMANLAAHYVVEHDDDTITVSPSILVTQPGNNPEQWHGWLEHGIWREE